MRRTLIVPCVIALSLCCMAAQLASSPFIRLVVDLTDAPRNIFHATVTLPANAGEMTFVYPKWIPGNHRPSGPIANVTGLHFRAGDQELTWHRDPLEMYSFHVTVPPGVREIEAKFDLLSSDSAGGGGLAASSNCWISTGTRSFSIPTRRLPTRSKSPLRFVFLQAGNLERR